MTYSFDHHNHDAPQHSLAQAQALHQSGHLDEAEKLYRDILDTEPNYAEAFNGQGAVFQTLQRFDNALASYENAIALKPDYPEAFYNRGIALQNLLRFDEALESYNQAIALKPQYAAAFNNRGTILYSQGHLESALESYDQAIALHPHYAEAFNNRGVVLQILQRQDEALASYKQAILINPRYAEAHYNLGTAFQELRQLEDAVESFNAAISIKPNYADALNDRGGALQDLKRFDEALISYHMAITVHPHYAEAFNNRGTLLHEINQLEDALANYNQAISINPNYPEAFNNRGNVLRSLRNFDEAMTNYKKAVSIKPNYAEAFNNLGSLSLELKRFDAALEYFNSALAIKPDSARILSSKGNALRELKRFDEALATYEKTLTLAPHFAEAFNDRANLFKELKLFGEALSNYDRALTLDPKNPNIQYNKSICQLLLGLFKSGWQGYESRLDIKLFNYSLGKANHDDHPRWEGDTPLTDKTILLHVEQGIGDIIQFCRYAPLVAERGGHVILEVPEQLKSLLAYLHPSIEIIVRGDPIPPYDVQNSLMSLPRAFNTTMNTIPAQIPYLFADIKLIDIWKQRLGEKTSPRIGLVWSGNSRHKNDHNRSLPLNQLLPITELPFQFYSLQKDIRETDQEPLAHSTIEDLSTELYGFSDTAALISQMDLIITVDTSTAHLAGALGKPVWILLPFLPDWRWLLDREDSPWYPTARLFRQPQHSDWKSVVENVKQALQTLKF